MKTKQTIETHLDCKATAALQESIINDMNQQDGSLASLLKDDAKEEDNNDTKSSD